MISLPRYYGVEAEPWLESNVRMGGFYRAVLTGPDGRVKHDSGWKKNQVLATGIAEYLDYDRGLYYMYYGTSNAAANSGQTGLQGTLIPADGSTDYTFAESPSVDYFNAGPPNYEASVTMEYITLEGKSTGTIGEACLGYYGRDPYTQMAIRFALDTPIVKGPDDVLTMQYRFVTYLDLTTKTGVVDISGVPYDYTFKRCDIDYSPHDFQYQNWTVRGSWSYFKVKVYDTPLVAITEQPALNYVDGVLGSPNNRTGLIMGRGGTVGNYYWTLGASEDAITVDELNGTWETIYFQSGNGIGGWQCNIRRVSDGAKFTKLNTHVMNMQMRLYVQEYIP